MKKSSILVLFIALAFLGSCTPKEPIKDNPHPPTQDELAVKAAILDYVEGLYLADSTRIERSVDTTLRKIGYWYHPQEKTYQDNLSMSYTQLVGLAARWNTKGDKVNDSTPKIIEIYDVSSKTASAKLTAAWGIDYFHLSKVKDQWKIMNVIWQSMPEQE